MELNKILILLLFLFMIIPVCSANDNITTLSDNTSHIISPEQIKENPTLNLNDSAYELNFTYLKINDSHVICGKSQNTTIVNSKNSIFDIDNTTMIFKNLSLNNITFLINNGKMHFQNISLNNCNFRLSNDCEIVFNNVNIIYSNLFKNNVVELRFNYSNNLYANITNNELLFDKIRLFKGYIETSFKGNVKINDSNLINTSIVNKGNLILDNISFSNSIIENNAILNASNCIFTNKKHSNIAVIKNDNHHSKSNIINCTFINNTANFGGAIFLSNFAIVNYYKLIIYFK